MCVSCCCVLIQQVQELCIVDQQLFQKAFYSAGGDVQQEKTKHPPKVTVLPVK